MSDKMHMVVESPSLQAAAIHRAAKSEARDLSILALGYRAKDGSIVVTNVLCSNFPDLTDEELGKLSWQLTQWGANLRR